MKKIGSSSKVRSVRGATLVEYVLLCVAVTVGSGIAVKAVGKEVSKGATETITSLRSSGN